MAVLNVVVLPGRLVIVVGVQPDQLLSQQTLSVQLLHRLPTIAHLCPLFYWLLGPLALDTTGRRSINWTFQSMPICRGLIC